jgi:NDP-sugar pyrophosphorylase family protein
MCGMSTANPTTRVMQDLGTVTAAILVGGLGTRLRSVVAGRPKVLAEVRGRPFLSYLLDQLAGAGIREAVLCTGYLGEQVRAAFGGSYRGVRLAYSQEAAPLGTAGALRLAAPLLTSPAVLVLNGDSYCQADLAAMWRRHRDSKAAATILLARVEDTRRFGRVRTDDLGRVVRFEEKGGPAAAGWINAGIYLMDRGVLDSIPAGRAASLEKEVFPAWIGRGLWGHRGGGRFLDIGTPESYREAEVFFASGGMV